MKGYTILVTEWTANIILKVKYVLILIFVINAQKTNPFSIEGLNLLKDN